MNKTEISRELFEQQRRPRFGTANPERMQLAFWEWMIRGDRSIPSSTADGDPEGPAVAAGENVVPRGYWPHNARKFFDVPHPDEAGPIWTFERYGATRNELPDGRTVCIGGEHEDFYDQDFHIYNDVVVFTPDKIEIYGYPKEVFPLTDFHTATQFEDKIVIIGTLGYQDARSPGHTPVYILDLLDYSISKLDTSGEAPGWISEHVACKEMEDVISIQGGKLIENCYGKQRHRRNCEDYRLNVSSGVWRRVTNRNWPQFSIRQEDNGLFVLERGLEPQDLVPPNLMMQMTEEQKLSQARILIGETPIFLAIGVSAVEVIIEGELPSEIVAKVVERIRVSAEAKIKRACIADQA